MVRSLAAIVGRLTAPKVIRGDRLPLFGQICRVAGNSSGDSSAVEEPKQFYEASNDVSTFQEICNAARSHRLVFFGEQHDQAKVLSAQLQTLFGLLKDRPASQKVHVVFEHWSLSDQPFLDRLNRAHESEEVARILSGIEDGQQDVRTSEGFRFSHYAVLLKLVREMCGYVWAGFPPREWARMVAKGGKDVLKEVQQNDEERYRDTKDECIECIPPMPVESYDSVCNVSWPHRSYLKSMFAPDQRPQYAGQSSSADNAAPPFEPSGFTAAQALKDTFFAHTITTILRREPNNIVIGVCGLGHCEWSFGAPERVVGEESYIIITKPLDSAYWPANDDEKEQNGHVEWRRKQADAVLLYEWID